MCNPGGGSVLSQVAANAADIVRDQQRAPMPGTYQYGGESAAPEHVDVVAPLQQAPEAAAPDPRLSDVFSRMDDAKRVLQARRAGVGGGGASGGGGVTIYDKRAGGGVSYV